MAYDVFINNYRCSFGCATIEIRQCLDSMHLEPTGQFLSSASKTQLKPRAFGTTSMERQVVQCLLTLLPLTTTETAAIAQWDKDERSAKSLLTQKLPDLTVVMIHGKTTVRERWVAVVKEFSKKSAYAQTDMRTKFMAMRCPEKGNPREFLEGLRVKKEELSQAGVVINEKDYFSLIISSLPFALSNFTSSQLAAAQYLSSKPMTPDDLLSMLLEESDRQRVQYQRRRG